MSMFFTRRLEDQHPGTEHLAMVETTHGDLTENQLLVPESELKGDSKESEITEAI